MDTFLYSFEAIAPVFLLAIIGYILRRCRVVTPGFARMASRFCFTIGFPCLIFSNVATADFSELLDIPLILFVVTGIILSFLGMLLVAHFLPLPRSQKSVVAQSGFRSNSMMLGLPISTNLFGALGAAMMSITSAFALPFYNLFVVLTFQIYGDREAREKGSLARTAAEVARNPLIIASILGLFVSALGIPLPSILTDTVEDIAGIATPLALICLGATFDFSRMLRNLLPNLVGSLCRLVIVPLVSVLAAIALGFRGVDLGTIFILFANPVSSTSYVMADIMGGDGELAGEIILTTVFFSMFTLFTGIYILRALALI